VTAFRSLDDHDRECRLSWDSRQGPGGTEIVAGAMLQGAEETTCDNIL
jgi:hypothetical protein